MRKLAVLVLIAFISCLVPVTDISCYAEVNDAASPGYIKASAGDDSVIALKSDGTVWTWGRNDAGQIGDGTEGLMDFRTSPVQVRGISDAVDVASGGGYNAVLRKDGSVWAWGIWGRAVEDAEYSRVPVRVEGFNDISAIAVGSGNILALKKNGTVWMLETNPLLKDYWSDDLDYGEAESDGSGYIDYEIGERAASYGSEYERLSESKTPYQVKNLTGIKGIYAYGNFSGGAYVAVKEDGTVWTWGGADYEDIVEEENSNPAAEEFMDEIDVNNDSYYVPTQVKGISGVVMAAPANDHMLALKNDGTVWTWGIGIEYVTVGPGSLYTCREKYYPPTRIPELSNVAYITAMPDEIIMNSAIAVKKDGTVWRMHLYTGSSYAKVEPLAGVKSATAGNDFILFIKADGTIWSCGNNEYGQLGNGCNSAVQKPQKLTTIDNVAAFGTGANNSIALKKDGTLWHWGTFTEVLGSGRNFKARQLQFPKPTLIEGMTGIIQVSAGANLVTMVKNDGTAWAMGGNSIGELGNGTKVFSPKPVKISGLNGVKKIFNVKVDQYDYSVALMSDGTLRSWGDNQKGQLGDGTKTTRTTPVVIKGINNVVSVALGGSFGLALKNDGTVWGWGDSSGGMLGKGVKGASLTPVKINSLTDVTAIATSTGTAAALKKDGTIWAWGSNDIGQLAQDIEKTSYSVDPVKIPIENVKAIAVGNSHVLALKQDGTVWTWGDSGYEIIDDSGYDKIHLVRQVSGLSSIVEITAANSHSMALRSDGTLWVWGNNKNGQLGNGGGDMFYPIKVIR